MIEPMCPTQRMKDSAPPETQNSRLSDAPGPNTSDIVSHKKVTPGTSEKCLKVQGLADHGTKNPSGVHKIEQLFPSC